MEPKPASPLVPRARLAALAHLARRISSRAAPAAAALALAAALLAAACSALLDDGARQCSTSDDCLAFGGRPLCQRGLCVASNLGPEGCFFGTPTTPEEFANQCSTAQCEIFDNCARLGLCKPGDAEPATIAPGAQPPGTPPTDPPPGPSCLPAGKNTVVVSGSTALQPFLAVVARVLAESNPPYVIAYQATGSCNGVDHIFNADPNKRLAKDTAGRTNLLFDGANPPVNCTFGTTGVPVDVGISDVFSSSCNPAYVPDDVRLVEYQGPVQPMTFVVPSTSTEKSISAEMGRLVFGRGGSDASAMPYSDPTLFFVRNSGSGTQQMISRAIGVEAQRWWGVDRGGSSRVRDQMLTVPPALANGAIGILSADFADAERARLRILAFRARNQICGYYPDSSPFTRDKRNVRDGHYSIWGPIHFYTQVSGGIPSAAAGALVTRFTVPRLDQSLLDAIIKSGMVPQCAMKVARKDEMGPLSLFSPEFQCGCYFEATVPGGSAPESCQTCNGPADCPSSTPACNNGYCELK